MTDRDDERAAVVAWLREQVGVRVGLSETAHRLGDWPTYHFQEHAIEVLKDAADAIEAGEHRKETGK